MDPRPALSVVIPVRDEEAVVDELHRRLAAVLDALQLPTEILFIDDGSRDLTVKRLRRIRRFDSRVQIIRLSRNFGHQAALTAGLDLAAGRAVVVMDGDLQDPPETIPALLDAWRSGFDVAYAVRRSRREGPLLQLAYRSFYRLLRRVSDLDIPLDSGDFCLLDRKVVRALRRLPERVRFVRGLRRYVGFRQTGVPYDREARAAGKPKYRLASLLGLAVDGLVSFSGKPLRIATYLGLATALAALALTVWVLADAITTHSAPRGWASTMLAVLFMGSVQLVCLGIVGEYLRLIFLESKQRTPYVIMSRTRPRNHTAGRTARGLPRTGPPRARPR